ncbi:hypothetical protein OOZ15_07835 [Galbibacter sp. EGI 63066]|uniref:hypothetical protein n=1 Tax=Galbibacter sp. EGI 63066 TaxID=2993559 RepID=UPI0022494580|nr:hypothetical protein [Galbibacter sp. EGI 63066]MCX2679842.1 hypothetical protein [Galbibacter sp. EGI 63066]
MSYYKTEADAEAGTGLLPVLYENEENPQTIYVRVDNDGTPENSCYAVAEATLEVLPLPAFELDESYTICVNSNGIKVASPAVLDTGLDQTLYAFEWTMDGNVLTETGSSYRPTAVGTYGVTVADLGTGCESSASTVVVASASPVLEVEVKTSAFFDGHVIVAVAEIVGGHKDAEFEYSLDNGPWQSSGTFTDVPPGEHVVTARDLMGCGTATATVMAITTPGTFMG